jgi:hypothetical protein
MKQNGYNQKQKIGLFITISALITILFLHFPFDGYITTTKAFVGCEKWAGTFCLSNQYKQEELPLNQWVSMQPIIPWFGRVINFIAATIFVIVVGGLWFYMFRDESIGQPDS